MWNVKPQWKDKVKYTFFDGEPRSVYKGPWQILLGRFTAGNTSDPPLVCRINSGAVREQTEKLKPSAVKVDLVNSNGLVQINFRKKL